MIYQVLLEKTVGIFASQSFVSDQGPKKYNSYALNPNLMPWHQVGVIVCVFLRPNAKAGSKRKSGTPDFFRLPCGARPIRVYLRYTIPPALSFNKRK